MGIFLNTQIEQQLLGIEFFLADDRNDDEYNVLSIETYQEWQQLDKSQVAELIATLTDYYNLMK